jgi:hypothetical protein
VPLAANSSGRHTVERTGQVTDVVAQAVRLTGGQDGD